jgi:hypothetical protein
VAAEMVQRGGDARDPSDDRRTGTVCLHRQGGGQPADGHVCGVRRVRDACDGGIRRHPARQAHRPCRPRGGRKHPADDRNGGHVVDRPGRRRDPAGHVRGVLRRRRRSERSVRRDRCTACLRAAGCFAGNDQHDPGAPGGVVASVGCRDRGGARALATTGGRPAACRRLETRSNAGRPARRRSRRHLDPERLGCVYQRQARAPYGIRRHPVSTDRACHRRSSARERGRVARVDHLARRRLHERARRPRRRAANRSRPARDDRRRAARCRLAARGGRRSLGSRASRAPPHRQRRCARRPAS